MTIICIDGYNLSLPKGTGIATYGRSLLSTLSMNGVETQVLLSANRPLTQNSIINESIVAEKLSPKKHSKSIRYKWGLKQKTSRMKNGVIPTNIKKSTYVKWDENIPCDEFWASNDLFWLANRSYSKYNNITDITFNGQKSPDVMHWTMPMPLHAKNIPNIITIHDTIPISLPYTTDSNRESYYNLLKDSVLKCDHIFTVSESTKRDIVNLLHVDDQKITVTYQAHEIGTYLNNYTELDSQISIRSTFNLDWKEYFIFFGAFEPKKNIGKIVEAYLASGSKSVLVLAGSPGWMSEQDLILMKQFHSDPNTDSSRIRVFNYVSRDMLLGLIRGAKATLFPSLYEGFGLPVLESMSLGTPVLTSDRGSLPEVTGNAALTVCPTDLKGIIKGIRTLENDTDWLREASKLGIIQAARFSPNAYLKRLTTGYRNVGIELERSSDPR